MTKLKLTKTFNLRLKKYFEKILYLSLFSCIAFTSATYADDTEVFKTVNAADGSTPNVLLLFDSSASMNQSISYIEGYDVTDTMVEVDGCRNDVIYVKTGTNNQLPSCGNNAINPAAFVCEDIASLLVEIGTINARVKQLVSGPTNSRWGNFQDGFPNAKIECLADQGLHGDSEVVNTTGGKVSLSTALNNDGGDTYIKNALLVLPTRGYWDATPDTSVTFDDDSFVTFYTGHYLNYVNSGTATEISENGIDLATTALSNIIADFTTINLGIGRYNQGGNKDAHILAPIVSLAEENNRQDLVKYYLGSLPGTLNGQQPMEAGQYEAYLYFKGEEFTPGATPTPPLTNSGTGTPTADDNDGINTIPSAFDPANTSRYLSPITAGDGACQGNYVLFVTAGGSSGVSNATERNINDATGWLQAADKTVATTTSTLSTQNGGDCGNGSDECLDELTGFMFHNDLVDLPGPIGVDENGDEVIQNVVTYGVSINAFDADLDTAAIAGGGRFTKAESPAAIEATLREILNEIIGNNTSFVAPSISVNNFNRLQNLNDLYYSLFTPTDYGVWDGNLKKYKLIDGVIKDALDNLAVDTDTGAFKAEALSYWTNASDPRLAANEDSPNTDGDLADLGGFASRRLRTPRNIYTNIDDDNSLTNLDALAASNASITAAVLNVDTLGLTATEESALVATLKNWGSGLKYNSVTGSYVINDFIGDLLHTTPVVLTYDNNATSADDLDQTIYFGTNNGYIHAAKAKPNTTESIEVFAYAPHETLSKLNTYYKNDESSVKLYGIDGPMTSWIDETDNDRIIDSTEDAYVYATQRRGGRNIYALEVSDRANPELAWKIRGGVDTGFGELGQTWSAVQHATIKDATDSTTPLEVAFFAGGYDINQDAASSSAIEPASATSATMGRAIYMVNAKTGALLWRASKASSYAESVSELDLPNMDYAIPSDLQVLDVNSDGYTDRIYVGDLGGQVWRFDLTTPTNNIDQFRITGGVIANLSKSNATDTSALDTSTGSLNNKRFYNAPSVSLVSNNAYGTYLALSIGSGYRAHPLDEVLNEKFYMIKDTAVYAPQVSSGNPVYPAANVIYDNTTDLVDISNIALPTFAQISGRRGWSIDFANSGEKVINPAITADNKVFFTTFIPQSSSASTVSCVPNAQLGNSRLYGVSLITGGIVNYEITYDSNGDVVPPTIADRFIELASPGISPPPEIFIESVADGVTNASTAANCSSSTAVTLLVGTETVNPNVCTAPVRTYWQRVEE